MTSLGQSGLGWQGDGMGIRKLQGGGARCVSASFLHGTSHWGQRQGHTTTSRWYGLLAPIIQLPANVLFPKSRGECFGESQCWSQMISLPLPNCLLSVPAFLPSLLSTLNVPGTVQGARDTGIYQMTPLLQDGDRAKGSDGWEDN